MKANTLLYVGSIVILLWGISHIVPTPGVVEGFGPISQDNRLIITMEWVAEGLTLCFVGGLVLYVRVLVIRVSRGDAQAERHRPATEECGEALAGRGRAGNECGGSNRDREGAAEHPG